MLLKQEQITPCEVEIEVEVAAEKVNSAIDRSYADLSQKTTIPGFRKGKAPRAVLERFLDSETVKDRAAHSLLQDAYSEALAETKLQPFAPADVNIVKFVEGEPMVFTAKVPLRPQVELGEYIGLQVERRVREVTDEDVNREVDLLREDRAEWLPVADRPVTKGDRVLFRIIEEGEEKPPMAAIAGENLPDFDKGLIGMSVDEEKIIEVTYPQDHGSEELAGQTRPLAVKLLAIEEKHVPELTDDWVRETYGGEDAEKLPESERIDTVAKLRARVRSILERSAVEDADEQVREAIIEKVVKGSKICFPQVLLDEAVGHRIADLVEHLNERKLTLEDYLKHTKQTEEDLRKRYAEESRSQLELLLVFNRIAEEEKMEVSDEEFDSHVRSLAESRGATVEAIRAYVDKTDAAQTIRNRILRKKVVDFLVHASNIKGVGRQETAKSGP